MLFCILLGTSGKDFNADTFVDLILDIRKFYVGSDAASVIFVHPGDIYGDYGGHFKISSFKYDIIIIRNRTKLDNNLINSVCLYISASWRRQVGLFDDVAANRLSFVSIDTVSVVTVVRQ